MRISDWSSDVCSSDLAISDLVFAAPNGRLYRQSLQRTRYSSSCLITVVSARHFRQYIASPFCGMLPFAGNSRRCLHANSITTNRANGVLAMRSEEHTSELQSLMRTSYAVLCLTTKQKTPQV